jgi:hypothetical protein
MGLARAISPQRLRHRRRLLHPTQRGRDPGLREQNKTGVSRAPALEAIKYCWPDMVRVMCVALMNTVATVATIFGAAYAVQPAYGIASTATSTCGFRCSATPSP